MPETRLGTAAELWDFLSEGGIIRDQTATPGDTTVATASVPGALNLLVASETNFSVGDLCRVGSGEILEVFEIEVAGVGDLTLKSPLEYGHAIGETVFEQLKVDMGHISEAGVTLSVSEDVFEVRASTSPLVLSRRTTGIDETISWEGINILPSNLAAVFGIDDANVFGTGVAADPYGMRINPNNLNELKLTSMYFTGVREDGDIIEIRGWNCRYDLNKTSTFARNAVAGLPLSALVKTVEMLRWTP